MRLTLAPMPFSALSPFQFRSQHVKERALSMQQLHLILRLAAVQPVAIQHRHPDLPIDTEVRIVFAGAGAYLDLRAVMHNQRAMSKRVRGNRRDYESIHLR